MLGRCKAACSHCKEAPVSLTLPDSLLFRTEIRTPCNASLLQGRRGSAGDDADHRGPGSSQLEPEAEHYETPDERKQHSSPELDYRRRGKDWPLASAGACPSGAAIHRRSAGRRWCPPELGHAAEASPKAVDVGAGWKAVVTRAGKAELGLQLIPPPADK
ncbi:hypothetical protein SEVIR_9G323000v4 [Setaria viridis]|uniref:Uncharacterized protein n=1 Tax=Setaria viridis TaxID=4556 RepID=A0A4U6T4E0_SETVI|nr:hypothetical protein SEVIR_9G323000v2 [Setaria viridis]